MYDRASPPSPRVLMCLLMLIDVCSIGQADFAGLAVTVVAGIGSTDPFAIALPTKHKLDLSQPIQLCLRSLTL
jgi:hypothetical protein